MAVGVPNYPSALDTISTLLEVANDAAATLTIAAGAGDATLTVNSTAAFPTTGSVSIDNEIIFYSGKTANTFTGLTRGADGTVAAAHGAGSIVELRYVAQHHEGLRDTIIQLETKVGVGSGAPPSTAGYMLQTTGGGATGWVLGSYLSSGGGTVTGNVTITRTQPLLMLNHTDTAQYGQLGFSESGGALRGALQFIGSTFATVDRRNGLELQNVQAGGSVSIWTANTERLRVTSGGFVGIGTASPQSTLDVVGSISVRVNQGYFINKRYDAGAVTDRVIDTGYAFDYYLDNATGRVGFRNTPTSVAAGTAIVMQDRLSIMADGRVGIGTTSPTSGYMLHVAGSTRQGSQLIDLTTGSTVYGRLGGITSALDWLGITLNASFNGTNWLLDDTNKVGWFFKLDARSTLQEVAIWHVPAGANPRTNEYPVFIAKSTTTSIQTTDAATNTVVYPLTVAHQSTAAPAAGLGAGIMLQARRSDALLANVAYIAAAWEVPTAGSDKGALVFGTSNNGVSERMRITSDGRVGIGTNNPQTGMQLHLVGHAIIRDVAAPHLHLYSSQSGNTTYGRLHAIVADWIGMHQNMYYSAGTWGLDDTAKSGAGFAANTTSLWAGYATAGANPRTPIFSIWIPTTGSNAGYIGLGNQTNPTSPIHHSTGATLSTGGVWTNAPSWAALKTGIKYVGRASVARLLEWMRTSYRPVRYRYHAEHGRVRHLGFLLDELPASLRNIFTARQRGGGISTKDTEGLLLALVQELARRTYELTETVRQLQAA